jgi:hypothetical protein
LNAKSISGGRSASGKKIARRAAGLLTSSRLLPDSARAGATRTLETIIKGVETSLRIGEPVRVEITFTLRGKILIADLGSPKVMSLEKLARAKDDETALASAIKRGEAEVVEILRKPEMLTGERFAEIVGLSRMAVHKRLKKYQILGLEGAKRGVRYPDWQLCDDGRPAPGLSELLPKFAGKPWAAYRFLLQRHAGLGEMTAIDALKVGKKKAVLKSADTFLSDDFS